MDFAHASSSLRRQMSVDVNANRTRPTSFPFFHERSISQDRSSIDSFGSDRGVIRSDSQCSLTKRNFLRKRIIELKEHEGIKVNYRAVCFPTNPQLATVKWLGKINQIPYIGVELDNPISTSFPVTKEATKALPFPSKMGHGRLILKEDLVVVTDLNGNTILRRDKPPRPPLPLNIHVSQAAQDFCRKLKEFYEFSSNAENTLDKLGQDLDRSFSKRVEINPTSIAMALERHKSYLSDVEDQFALIDWCHKKSEKLFAFDDIILPSEERRINRTIEELLSTHANIETKLKRRIQNLELLLETCKSVQVLLNEKLDWLTATKAQLRHIEKSLIKTEKQLSSRIFLMENLLIPFCPTESEQIAKILEKISKLHELNGTPEDNTNSMDHPCDKFDSQLTTILFMRGQLVEEIGKKLKHLKEAQKLFHHFSTSISSFEEWYDEYFTKVCESQLVDESDAHAVQVNMEIVQEREKKREDFLEILQTARKLRVSIFDASVLDDRIQSVQMKWRTLMDRCYRDKFRKTV